MTTPDDPSASASLEAQLLLFARETGDAARRARQTVAALEAALSETERSFLTTTRALALSVEARDTYTGGHLERVRVYGKALLDELGVADEYPGAEYGFLLHDVGKVGIPDSILHKAGALDEAEWTVMRTHPVIGYQFLESIPYLRYAADIVRCHHERFDGKGYPHGLRGEEIALPARAFPVADTFDAMTTTRPYRRGLPWEDAAVELSRVAGTQLDPDCVEAFLRVLERHGGPPPTG